MKIFAKNIIVENMKVGILPSEYVTPQKMLVDVVITVQDVLYPTSIDACYNYAEIVNYVRAFEKRDHIDLIETIASDILDFIFKNPKVEHAMVTVKKPDIFSDVECVGVTYERFVKV